MSTVFIVSRAREFHKALSDGTGYFTLSLPESIMETCNVVLTFESVDEIPWCDHSNEISLTILSHGTVCLAGFEKLKIVIFLEFLFGHTSG